MRFLTVLLFCLVLPVSALAQQDPPGIEGFTVGVPVEHAKAMCLLHKDAVWEALPKDEEFLGLLYTCKGTAGPNLFMATFYSYNNVVSYLRFMVDLGPQMCKKVNKALKANLPCSISGDLWRHCGDSWQLNCYVTSYEGVQVSIFDLIFRSSAFISI